MKELIINKMMQPGETSKVEKYSKIVDTLISKAKELTETKIVLSAEFAPILCFTDIKKETPNYSIGEYLFGTKENIEFYISPKYDNGGRIGNLEIKLLCE